jgi:ABC-type glycerol-3-phosphate transport system permease component
MGGKAPGRRQHLVIPMLTSRCPADPPHDLPQFARNVHAAAGAFEFTDTYGLPLWNLQLAATTLAVVPILIVYLIAQRQIIESFALSGVVERVNSRLTNGQWWGVLID